ncbi:MAG: mersacidin/lichenicidin family type 2 lantibiotic [Coleofasciculus sp. G2-EDA-02]
MSNLDIIRAWKDEEYRNSLSEEQRAQLPENPAGMVELSDEAMQNIGGGGFLSIFGCGKKGGNTSNPVLGICIKTVGVTCLGGGNTGNPVFGVCLRTQGLTCSTVGPGGRNFCNAL